MRTLVPRRPGIWLLAVLAVGAGVAGCSNTPTVVCAPPTSRNLDTAIRDAERSLTSGCETHFDEYYHALLSIAEGDPSPANKRSFSEFLVWSADTGLLSKRQAQERYNRYFNVKFTSLRGEYNNCAYTCPRQDQVLGEMEHELADKELGLMRISLDSAGYNRADLLYQETELVLEATCSACAAGR